MTMPLRFPHASLNDILVKTGSCCVILGPIKGQTMTQNIQKHIQHTKYKIIIHCCVHRKQYHQQSLITPHLVISLFPLFSTSIDLPHTLFHHQIPYLPFSLFDALSLFQRHAHMYVRQKWSLETMSNALCLSSCISYCILRSTGHLIDLPSPTSLTHKHVYLAV